MAEQRNVMKDAEDFVRSALEKNFGQRVKAESARGAAEKIVRGLPVAAGSKQAA